MDSSKGAGLLIALGKPSDEDSEPSSRKLAGKAVLKAVKADDAEGLCEALDLYFTARESEEKSSDESSSDIDD